MGAVKTDIKTTFFRPVQKIGFKDRTLGQRVVGYYEFAKALEQLADLIDQATDEEIKVFDQVIASRPEFRIYTNLARGIENPNSRLKIEPKDAKDDFSRSGLFWLTGLARIEFATTRSIFHGDKSPFLEYAPTNPDEQLVYFELLLDSFKSHYYDTMDSIQLKKVVAMSRNGASQEVLAYIRRLALMADMYAALIPAARETFDETQLAEFKSMGKKFHQKFQGLTHNVGKNLAQKNDAAINSTTSSYVSTFYESCNKKCQALASAVGGF